MTLGQCSDLPSRHIVHAAGDEPFDPTIEVDDPHGRVLGADQRTNLVDDDLQCLVDGGETGDASDGGVESGLNLSEATWHYDVGIDHLGARIVHALGVAIVSETVHDGTRNGEGSGSPRRFVVGFPVVPDDDLATPGRAPAGVPVP